jgi:hypothetical protein
MTCASAVRKWSSLSGQPSYYSRNFANEIMAGKLSWTEQVACVWEVRKFYRRLSESVMKLDRAGDPGIDVRAISGIM